MRMTIFGLGVIVATSWGCTKAPTCEDAISNYLKVTEKNMDADGIEVATKLCKDEWGKETKKCFSSAKTKGEAKECEFMAGVESARAGSADKYIAKSKTGEAIVFIKKMSDGARVFFMEPNYAGNSIAPVGPSFPKPSSGVTPPKGTCCRDGGKCKPNPTYWNKEPWISLQFSVDDPHYYSYEYEVAADGMSYAVRAYGDLDCDGEYSKFEMNGRIVNGEPSGANEVSRENELE